MKNFFHKRAYEKKAAKIDFLSPATVKYVGWSMHSVQVDDESSRCMRAHLCCGFGSSEVARRSDSSSRYKDTNLQVMGWIKQKQMINLSYVDSTWWTTAVE